MAVRERLLNPFPGLRPFEGDEAHLFFGRDGQSDELLRRLRLNRFVAVVGTSGSGKSSLVRAGLLPSLYGGFMVQAGSSWRVAMMRPGNHPIGNLAEALSREDVLGTGDLERAIQKSLIETTLRRGALGLVDAARQARMPAGDNLLIVVDQFEELFRFKQRRRSQEADEEAAAFVKLLLEAATQQEAPIYVVLTMRSDYLGDCAQFRDLPEAINDGQYLIPRMTRDQRREAIEGPVAVGGAAITPRLVNCLLNDVGDNADQLPLLQHALMRMWLHQERPGDLDAPLDLAHYEAIGGLSESLSRHADEAYDELGDPRRQEVAEKLFKCLTEKGSDNRETRRPTTMRDLCAITGATEAEVIAVIESFRCEGRSFLTPPPPVPLLPDRLIDISHESLIRNWQRLKGWVEGEGLSASIYRRLAETSVLYRQDKAGLWRDPDLQIALSWRDKVQPNRAWGERYHPEFDSAMAFLDASRDARDAEAHEREQQRKRELRRTRLFVLILGTALILALALGAFALVKRNEAVQQRGEAERQKRNAEAALLEAEHQKERAEGALQETNHQKDKAEQEQKRAEAALKVAEERQREAERASTRAAIAEADAKKQEQIALKQSEIAQQQKEIAQREVLRVRRQSLETYNVIFNLANVLITKAAPGEVDIWRQTKAWALSQIGDHEDAIAQSTLVLMNDRTNLRSMFQRSYEYLTQGDAANALKDTDAYIEQDSGFWAIHQNRALALGLLGEYAAAAVSVSQGLDSFTQRASQFSESEISPEIQLATRRKVLTASEHSARLALHYEQATLKACAGDPGFEQALARADQEAERIVQKGKGNKFGAADGYLFALNWAWIHSIRREADYGALASQAILWERAGYPDWAWKYYAKFQEKYQQRADVRYKDLARWVEQQMIRLRRSSGPFDPSTLEKDYAPDAGILAFQAQELLTEAQLSQVERPMQPVPAKTAIKLETAHQRITEAIRLEPENIEFLMQRVWINNQRGDFLKVRQDCDEIIRLAPRPAFAYYWRAIANLNLGITGKAFMDDLRQAVAYDPSASEAYWFLSGGLLADQPDEAEDLLEQGFRTNVNFWELGGLYKRKAEIQVKKGNFQAALDAIETAIQMSQSDLSLYEDRARIEQNLQRSDVEIARHRSEGYSRAAEAKQKLGQASDALDAYRQSLRILVDLKAGSAEADVKRDVVALVSKISKLLADLGSKEKAIAFWRLALETGYLKGFEEIVNSEINRLSSGLETLRP
jgi:hypothetical protein